MLKILSSNPYKNSPSEYFEQFLFRIYYNLESVPQYELSSDKHKGGFITRYRREKNMRYKVTTRKIAPGPPWGRQRKRKGGRDPIGSKGWSWFTQSWITVIVYAYEVLPSRSCHGSSGAGRTEFIRAEILLPDMQRYTIAAPAIFGLFRYSDIGGSCTFAAISTKRPRRNLEAIASRS